MNGNSVKTITTYVKDGGDQKSFAIIIDNTKIDVAIINFSNRLFIIITQFGKLGTLVSVKRNFLAVGEEREVSYEIKTLFGDDQLNYHVAARSIAECIEIEKPLLLSIALQDLTFPALQTIRKAILENKIW